MEFLLWRKFPNTKHQKTRHRKVMYICHNSKPREPSIWWESRTKRRKEMNVLSCRTLPHLFPFFATKLGANSKTVMCLATTVLDNFLLHEKRIKNNMEKNYVEIKRKKKDLRQISSSSMKVKSQNWNSTNSIQDKYWFTIYKK